MIPYGRHSIDSADLDAISDVLDSGWLTQGPRIQQFEEAIAQVTGSRSAVTFNSATSALHAACLAMGVGNESHVWVPANSFVATANCARYCGASVTFVDIDPQTGALSVDDLEERLNQHRKNGQPLPDLVITVHYAGHLSDLLSLKRLSMEFGFAVIEDASHALGAEPPDGWNDDVHGDIRVYSFHPVKMITSAEGGAAVTNDATLERRLRLFGNHGIERDPHRFVYDSDGPWYYEQQCLGYNYRMNDLQAALGLSQLQRLPQFLESRRAIADVYDQELPDSIEPVAQHRFGRSSYHLYPVLVPETDATEWFHAMRAREIGVQKHYIPIPAQPYYRELYPEAMGQCPQALTFYRRVMALPIFPDLEDDALHFVLDTIRELAHDPTELKKAATQGARP